MKRAVAAFVAAIAAVALLPSAAHAKPSDPPRAQFWVHPGFSGDKLDKDAPGSEGNLVRLGRGCYVFGCSGNWNDQISTLWTTGGGQPPSWLEIFEDIDFAGHCVLIPPNHIYGNLSYLTTGLPSGRNWNDRISSFIVYDGRPSAPRPYSRCPMAA